MLIVDNVLIVESDILRVQQVFDRLVEGIRRLCHTSSHTQIQVKVELVKVEKTKGKQSPIPTKTKTPRPYAEIEP